MSKVVLIRLDKIGDLIATYPVDQADFLKSKQVTWIIEKNLKTLNELSEPVRECLYLDLKKPLYSFFELLKNLKNLNPEIAVVFYAPWWVSLALWLAKIRIRAGRLSQWHSLIFFNKRLRQSRSQSEKHEVEYNWELLHFAFDQKIKNSPPFYKLQAQLHRHLFEKFGLASKNYIVVHPGMAGSALNWPQKSYNTLIEQLVMTSPVVITGTAADNPYMMEIAARWRNHPNVKWLKDQLNFSELIFILQNASQVIAPSTGVLHLAAGTGTPVVGIYSPVLAHHPRRWGPRGLGARIVLPDVQCPAKIKCLKEKCSYHPCMQRISDRAVMNLMN
jgi:heptosyltransferase I